MTTTRRLAVLLLVFLAWVPAARAWSWPVQGAVLQPFSYDEAHPYASGQHRGVDIGAGAVDETVVAPAAGTVSFAGSVPTSGKSVTIETDDGYAVTLTHLGSIGVARGSRVDEQDALGTVGPSGTPEVDGPYLHLGIRVAADPNGYVDPVGLLPAPVAESAAAEGGATASQPGASSGASAPAPPPATEPAPAAGPTEPAPAAASTASPTRTPAATVTPTRTRVSSHRHGSSERTRAEQRQRLFSHPPASRPATTRRAMPHARPSESPGSSRRPIVEPVAPAEPTALDTRHEVSPSPQPVAPPRRKPSGLLLAVLCNWLAALFALGAALAGDMRRRHAGMSPTAGAEVHRLPRPAVRHRSVSRAA